MHALLIILAINAAMLGVVFTFGGFATIVAPSTAEGEEMRQAIEAARAKVSWLSVFIAHWPERRQGRRLIYIGAFCLAIAAAIGYHISVFET